MQFTAADNRGADIVLTSSDKLDFYVHKCNLIAGSKTFSDMFTLSQDMTLASSSIGTTRLPTVSLAEDSVTIGDILPYFYMYLDPKRFFHNKSNSHTVERTFKALQFVDKYEMNEMVKERIQLVMDGLASSFIQSTMVSPAEFYCFFRPACPSFLQDIKQKLFGKMVAAMPLTTVELAIQSFTSQDRIEFLCHHHKRITLQMLQTQVKYNDIKNCKEPKCSIKKVEDAVLELLAHSHLMIINRVVPPARPLDLCRSCKWLGKDLLREWRYMLRLPIVSAENVSEPNV